MAATAERIHAPGAERLVRIERIETIRIAEQPNFVWVELTDDAGRSRDRIRTYTMCVDAGGFEDQRAFLERPGAAALQLCGHAANAKVIDSVRGFVDGWYRDVVTEPFELADGKVTIPARPGLGTALRPEVRSRADATVRTSERGSG